MVVWVCVTRTRKHSLHLQHRGRADTISLFGLPDTQAARITFSVPPSALGSSQYPAFAMRISSTHGLCTPAQLAISLEWTQYSLTSKLQTGPALVSHTFRGSAGTRWIPDVLPPAFSWLFLPFSLVRNCLLSHSFILTLPKPWKSCSALSSQFLWALVN